MQIRYHHIIIFLVAMQLVTHPANAQSVDADITRDAAKAFEQNLTEDFVIVCRNSDSLLLFLEKHKEIELVIVNKPSSSVVIRANGKMVKKSIQPLPFVLFIDKKQQPHIETAIIGYNRGFHGISALNHSFPAANGHGITVGIKEQKPESADLDLFMRVKTSVISAPAVSNHATVIASIAGGAGNSFYDGRGIAHACEFYPSSFENLFADDAGILNSNQVTVQNHSYGTVVQQFYGAEALSYDVQAWQNEKIVHVFSAGNSGTASAAEGPYTGIAGFANLTGNFKMAKNIISVAAITNSEALPAESSSGPLYDGRLAPQLTALGPNGTSDAAAMVSGTAALLQQLYADSNGGHLPPASLVKSVLYSSADDVGRPGIDYKTGYGLLNSLEAVKMMLYKQYDTGRALPGQTWTKTVMLPAGMANLKITLAWTDTTAPVNNTKALTNDLDLELIHTGSGNLYQPWVLSTFPNADSLSGLPVRKKDTLNSSEQVSLELPPPGQYQIRIKGSRVQTSSQPYSVSWKTDTLNRLNFTYPLHASDVNRAENPLLNIRWKTNVADTNQMGRLFISFTDGASWQLISDAVKIYRNFYSWEIKDTASAAIFKIETGFGSFLSEPFVISPLTGPSVDYLCSDSFRFSWKPYVYAANYKIFALSDSPYLKPVAVTSDTFKIFQRNLFPYQVYAVEPVLTNGLLAARSIAIDVRLQGTSCFYRTFYYELPDGNAAKLILELSTLQGVDSIYFEKLTATGSLLQKYPSQAVSGVQLRYNQLISGMDAGIHYFRAGIRLNNGVVINTEIQQVLLSGPKKIWFYPNPVSRFSNLHYVLQQGTGAGNARLLIYDATGRVLRNYSSLPDVLNLGSFLPGVYFYCLKTIQGDEKGRIVVL